MPWGATTALLLACICAMFSPWMIYKIRSNVTYEFRLRFVESATPRMSDALIVRIHDDLKIHMGSSTFDILFPELRENDLWWKMEPVWRTRARNALLNELKKQPNYSTIVIRVDPNVRYDVIALAWTSIQAISNATLYLEVVAD